MAASITKKVSLKSKPTRDDLFASLDEALALRYSNPDAAHNLCDQVLEQFQHSKDQDGIGSALKTRATVLNIQSRFDESLVTQFKALKTFEKCGSKQKVAQMLNNIGDTFCRLQNWEKALHYLQLALDFPDIPEDNLRISNILSNIGNVYFEQELFAKAEEYYLQSLEFKLKTDDKKTTANLLHNMGGLYIDWNKPDEGIHYLEQALEIFEEIGDLLGVSSCYFNSAIALETEKRYEEALAKYAQVLNTAAKVGNRDLLVACYKELANLHCKLGNFDLALANAKMMAEQKKKIFNVSAEKRIAGVDTRYQADKLEKEKEIHRLKNVDLKQAYSDLKDAQDHLLAQKRLAKVGTLTARIGAEIETPLATLREKLHELNIDRRKLTFPTEEQKLNRLFDLSESIMAEGTKANNIIGSMLRQNLGHPTQSTSNAPTTDLIDSWLKE